MRIACAWFENCKSRNSGFESGVHGRDFPRFRDLLIIPPFVSFLMMVNDLKLPTLTSMSWSFDVSFFTYMVIVFAGMPIIFPEFWRVQGDHSISAFFTFSTCPGIGVCYFYFFFSCSSFEWAHQVPVSTFILTSRRLFSLSLFNAVSCFGSALMRSIQLLVNSLFYYLLLDRFWLYPHVSSCVVFSLLSCFDLIWSYPIYSIVYYRMRVQ